MFGNTLVHFLPKIVVVVVVNLEERPSTTTGTFIYRSESGFDNSGCVGADSTGTSLAVS